MNLILTELIYQSLAEKELLPQKHLVDADYVDGTLLVESKQKHDIKLMGPVRENVSWQFKNPDRYDVIVGQNTYISSQIYALLGYTVQEISYMGANFVT